MALIWADRVIQQTTTTGTGAVTLSGTPAGYQAFSAVCAVSDTLYYTIYAVDGSGVPTGDWETGLGTYSSANTLTRTTVHASSNAGSAVSLAAGSKYVMLAATAAKFVEGVSFPGSPATGQRFWRTDRNIEYFYDGTRWLSTQLHTASPAMQDVLNPRTSTGIMARWASPFSDVYDLYIETVSHMAIVTGTGNWTGALQNSTPTDVAAVTTSGTLLEVDTVNAVYDKTTHRTFSLQATENSGTGSFYYAVSFTYRLVG